MKIKSKMKFSPSLHSKRITGEKGPATRTGKTSKIFRIKKNKVYSASFQMYLYMIPPGAKVLDVQPERVTAAAGELLLCLQSPGSQPAATDVREADRWHR